MPVGQWVLEELFFQHDHVAIDYPVEDTMPVKSVLAKHKESCFRRRATLFIVILL